MPILCIFNTRHFNIECFEAKPGKWLQGILLALLICILYAVSDEVHQILYPAGQGEIRDVAIDCSGAGMGVLAYSAVSRIVKRMHSKG